MSPVKYMQGKPAQEEGMNLTQKVICYQAGQWSMSNILIDMRYFCRRLMRIRQNWSASEADEFFDSIQTKLVRAVRRFSYRGARFESYLKTIMYYQLRTFALRKRTDELTRKHLAETMQEDYQRISTGIGAILAVSGDNWPENRKAYRHEEEDRDVSAPFIGGDRLRESIQNLDAKKKSILLASLKNSEVWDDDLIQNISASTGLPEINLLGLRQELMEITETKRNRRNLMIERRNAKHMKVKRHREDPETWQHFMKGYSHTADAVQRVQTRATHLDISRICGIPKGTVDSNLYSISRRIGENQAKRRDSVSGLQRRPLRRLLE
jgi:DNA-directed RNA polymerase specialized sigma24 family protein